MKRRAVRIESGRRTVEFTLHDGDEQYWARAYFLDRWKWLDVARLGEDRDWLIASWSDRRWINPKSVPLGVRRAAMVFFDRLLEERGDAR